MHLPFAGENYLDYPDGENLGKKLWITVKNMGGLSACFTILDVALVSHPKGYAATLGRFAAISAPVIGFSSLFVVISNQAASYRKKDDQLNWVMGGIGTGIAVGAWRRSGMGAFVAAVGFGAYAFLQKDALMRNIPLYDFPNKIQTSSFRTPQRDYSLIAYRPGNWTTGK